MKKIKKIVFLTGTRADFGKIKPLILRLNKDGNFAIHIFVTGMHMDRKYGHTVSEIEKLGFPNIYKFINYTGYAALDATFSSTVSGFGNFIRELRPDMIVVHGDRPEALAGALVGSFNNILVAHIEGGEISGTLDESLRHAISKISHLHFVANVEAQKRLIQMGEKKDSIFVIGSPDIDLMKSSDLPAIAEVKKTYDIPFKNYGIFIFHPITTQLNNLLKVTEAVTEALVRSKFNYVAVYPNNDPGTDIILSVYKNKLFNNKKFVIHPSMRFEHFLSLFKSANFIVGNSSAGVREAPYYGVPTINIGDRQNNRVRRGKIKSIFNCGYNTNSIVRLVEKFNKKLIRYDSEPYFGDGNSSDMFLKLLKEKKIWSTTIQKQFLEVDF